jgi:oligopeptide/dipeptide ABC transporter ATP-binding protein
MEVLPILKQDDLAARSQMQRETGTLLSVRHLTVNYRVAGRQLAAVSGLTFDLSPGEIVGVLGESGCGKTTAALALLGILPDSAAVSGSVLFDELDLLSLSESEFQKIRGSEAAIIYQDSSVLNPVMRVGDQVSEVLRAHRVCGRRQAREEVESMLSAVGLRKSKRIYDAYPHQLSGGQRQRIAIAQALICKPRLVVADEPTASLDPDTTAEILSLMQRLRDTAGTSFLVISHDPADLAAIADRVIVMYAGEIVEQGTLVDVYSKPLHPYTRALLECVPARIPTTRDPRGVRMPTIPGYPPDPLDPVTGCAFSARCVDRMEACDSRKPELFRISPSRQAHCLKYAID